MFTKRAKSQSFDRRLLRGPAIPARACNDNDPAARPLVSAQRLRRPRLACRWRLSPTGALEAAWHAT
jgi:hypothetical protein